MQVYRMEDVPSHKLAKNTSGRWVNSHFAATSEDEIFSSWTSAMQASSQTNVFSFLIYILLIKPCPLLLVVAGSSRSEPFLWRRDGANQ